MTQAIPSDTIPSETSQIDAAATEEIQVIVDALDDKRAKDIVVLGLAEVSSSLEFFVVATGESGLQLQALESSVRERAKAVGLRLKGVEGPSQRWVLMDYGHVVVHLMSPEAREFYDLEGLWADAPRLEVVPR